MSTFHEEAAMSFGAANPLWVVALIEKLTGDEIHLEVRAADQRQAINKATDRANLASMKKVGGNGSIVIVVSGTILSIPQIGIQPQNTGIL